MDEISNTDSSINIILESLDLVEEPNGFSPNDIALSNEDSDDLLNIDVGDLYQFFDEEILVDLEESPYEEQWRKLKSVFEGTNADTTMLQALYDDFHFIIAFRIMFADEIEKKCWHVIDTDSHTFRDINFRQGQKIITDLLVKVNEALNNTQSSVEDQVNLRNWKKELENRYMQDPLRFVQFMLNLLKKEKDIIEMAEQQIRGDQGNNHEMFEENNMVGVIAENNQTPVDFRFIQQILVQLSELEQHSCVITGKVKKCVNDLQELFRHTNGDIASLDRYDLSRITDNNVKKNIEILRSMKSTFTEERQQLINGHAQIILTPLKVLWLGVQEQIKAWQRSQAYAENGKLMKGSSDIDQLEGCCRLMAQILYGSLDQIRGLVHIKIDINEDQTILAELQNSYECFVKELVANALVVEKQPPQVLMKDKKFGCRLRHLVGDGLGQVRFDTEISLISTEMACEVLEKGPTTKIKCSGKIINNITKSDFIEQTRQLHVQMRNMSLSMRQRGDRGRAAIVAEEKFCMIYRSKIPVRFPSNSQCEVIAQTMSLPIIVISHGKQEADAQATVFWDNAFSELNRIPFAVPDAVPWGWILDSLHWLWVKNCQKKQDLTQRNIVGLDGEKTQQYLTNKLFGVAASGKIGYNTMVSWRHFNRDNLPDLPFTFWMWLFKTMELVAHDLVRPYWNDSLIRGFISKKDCLEELTQCLPGTFMFRFSDTQPGGLSISCYSHSKEHGGRLEVGHLEPDLIKDLSQKEIPELVNDLQYLKYLHPTNIPKQQVFQKKVRKPTDGYVTKRLTATADNFIQDGFTRQGECSFVNSPTDSFGAQSPSYNNNLVSPSPSIDSQSLS